MVTGESLPVVVRPGSPVHAGTLNLTGELRIRVSSAGERTLLAEMLRLVEAAEQGRARYVRLADRAARLYAPAVHLLALAAFVLALLQGLAWQAALMNAVAVLIVTCPCALGLAVPAVQVAAVGRLWRRGILVKSADALERLSEVRRVVFDKTGTLTLGRPLLQRVDVLGQLSRGACLGIAAALEAGSAHPVGRAIVAAAEAEAAVAGSDCAAGAHAPDVMELPGQGLEGSLHGQRYRLGNAAFVAGLAGSAPAEALAPGMTPVYLGAPGVWLARFLLSDALREDAAATVDYFRTQGKQVMLLSGDDQALTSAVAAGLGIGTALGACLPDQKLAFVQQLQQGGAVVAMVGDGINDAAVLSAADVSFAMGSGAALAQAHADTVLLSGQLGSVADTARSAARAMGVIRQNLTWATLYNLLAIPAAALGYLNPWLSGVGMALSSAVVIANALRLRRH
jgi:Cu2+-exporting ATPase